MTLAYVRLDRGGNLFGSLGTGGSFGSFGTDIGAEELLAIASCGTPAPTAEYIKCVASALSISVCMAKAKLSGYLAMLGVPLPIDPIPGIECGGIGPSCYPVDSEGRYRFVEHEGRLVPPPVTIVGPGGECPAGMSATPLPAADVGGAVGEGGAPTGGTRIVPGLRRPPGFLLPGTALGLRPKSEAMSTGTKIGIGVGAVVVLALAYKMLKG